MRPTKEARASARRIFVSAQVRAKAQQRGVATLEVKGGAGSVRLDVPIGELIDMLLSADDDQTLRFTIKIPADELALLTQQALKLERRAAR